MPRQALDYLLKNIIGGETILFKGARFMEGIIEHLLLDKNDIEKLCRREKIWQVRRRAMGIVEVYCEECMTKQSFDMDWSAA